MDIHFKDLSEVSFPPDKVTIRELRAEPWADGRRVSIYLEVDPFQKPPNADLVIEDQRGQVMATTSIIHSMQRKMELTMHLRTALPGERYKLVVALFYAVINEESDPENELDPIERTVVDTAQVSFELPE